MFHPSSSNHIGSKRSTAGRSGSSVRSARVLASSTAGAKRSTSGFSRVHRAVTGLSDRGLLNSTAKLVKTERLTTLEILVHLNEVEKRELYLGLGCGSMFDYCVTQLGYSRSAAWRRIHSARCLGRHTEVYGLVERNELNLTTLFLITGVLTEDNKTDLLEQVRGRSENEVEKVLATYRPPVVCRDRVRRVRVAVPVTEDSVGTAGSGASTLERLAFQRHRRSDAVSGTAEGSGAADPSGRAGGSGFQEGRLSGAAGAADAARISGAPSAAVAPNSPRYTLEPGFAVEFVASEAFMSKYQEARSLLSNRLTKLGFEAVFGAALDAFLDKHSPARRQERREKRAAVKKQQAPEERSRTAATPETRAGHPRNPDANPAGSADQLSRKKFDGRCRSGTDIMLTRNADKNDSDRTKDRPRRARAPKPNGPPEKTRHISAKTRDAVFARDKNRCTHIGSNGKRCESTYRLHIDHIVPYARGGTHELSNLRLLCAKHNTLEAKRAFGTDKIDSYRRRE